MPAQKIEKEYEKNIRPQTYENLIKRNEEKINENAKNIEKIAITDTYTVAAKVRDIFKVLVKNKKFIFNRLFSVKEHNKEEVVTAFSGLLEMSRRNKIITNQEETFSDILVEKREISKESKNNYSNE